MRILLLLVLFSASCFAQTPKEATVRVYTFVNADGVPDYRGSGVLIRNSQAITNYHVVAKRRKDSGVTIRFSDGLRTSATVEFEDKDTDVALLKINPHPLFKPMEFGVDAEYHDSVVTYGFTYDYEYVRKVGDMWHRRSPGKYTNNGRRSKYDENGKWFVLISDLANRRVPGDSGGPAVKDGKVVGIVQGIGVFKDDNDNPFYITVCVRADAILGLIGDRLNKDLVYDHNLPW